MSRIRAVSSKRPNRTEALMMKGIAAFSLFIISRHISAIWFIESMPAICRFEADGTAAEDIGVGEGKISVCARTKVTNANAMRIRNCSSLFFIWLPFMIWC